MRPEDAFIELLDRVTALQGALARFSVDELRQWPREALEAMKAHKLITRARPASSVVCPGCEEECVMPVHTIPVASGGPAPFIVCDRRDDISRVPVPVARIEQWQASGDSVAELLASLLGLQRPGMGSSTGGRWDIGVFRGKKHASHLVLLADDKLTLTLAGHSIAVSEVLTINGGGFKADARRLSRLVDQPVAGAGDIESAGQRRERIRNRVNKLKAQGVKAFLKTVAEEEGLSVSRIKQLIQDDNPPPKSRARHW